MGRTFDAPEEVQGEGTYLKLPGTYHFAVNRIVDGEGPKGGVITGFTMFLSVLAGTVEGQKEQEYTMVLFDPDLSGSEKAQAWARKKQAAAFIALGLMNPSDLGKPGLSIPDLNTADGTQLIAKLEMDDYNDTPRLELSYADIWHVDDPRAKAFPKDESAFKFLPDGFRKKEEWFAPLVSKKGGGSKPGRLSEDDLDDL